MIWDWASHLLRQCRALLDFISFRSRQSLHDLTRLSFGDRFDPWRTFYNGYFGGI